jgi:hypothetical protein
MLAVPWLGRLVAGLSLWGPGYVPGSVHVGFVVDKVALGQIFLRVLPPPLSIIPPWLCISYIIRGMNNGPIGGSDVTCFY